MPAISSRCSTLARVVAVMLLMAVAASVAGIRPVSGQEAAREIEVFDVAQADLDGDGDPDQATIDCAYITAEDRVVVYDHADDMEWGDTWQEATDFDDDMWVFDAAADGRDELIIDFKLRRTGEVEAWIWDDQNGDGTVAYQITPTIDPLESANPGIKVIAADGWWARDGKINFNLDLTVDGQIQASMSAKPWLKNVSTDGAADFTIEVRDTDDDGRPDYQWVNAWPEAHSGYGIRRTEIVVSPDDDEAPITGSIFWPLLGSTLDWDDLKADRPDYISPDRLDIVQARSGYNKTYGISMPPIQVLWQKASLLYVSEFVASRFNDDNWFVYSIQRVTPDDLSLVNFEAPFAYYDLADDDDSYPELAVRFEQYLERDMFPFRRTNREPVQIIRYSWDQDNNTTWNYKLGLIGRNIVDQTAKVGNLTLQMIPHDDIPVWVTNQQWDGATFVAVESDDTWTSEGIYEWDQYGYWRDSYVTGLSTIPPTIDDLGGLAVGQRGEYAFDLHVKPEVYLSSVDHKLHLLGAEGGVWRVNETRDIWYANLGGDYINQWTLVENETTLGQISYVGDYIIYDGPTGIQLVQTDQAPALDVSAPPTDNASWRRLDQQLQQQESSFNDDFDAVMRPFGASVACINGASTRDLRQTDEGFRFILDVESDVHASGAVIPEVSDLDAGSYLITYDGSFQVEPVSPPDLSVALRASALADASVGTSVSILAEATNSGLTDAAGLWLVAVAEDRGNQIEVGREYVDVLSGDPARLAVDWKPPAGGTWELSASLMDENGTIIAESVPASVDIARGTESASQMLLLSIGGGWRLVPLAIALAAFAVMMLVVVRQALRANGRPPVGDQHTRG
jgi:hypothetical protein